MKGKHYLLSLSLGANWLMAYVASVPIFYQDKHEGEQHTTAEVSPQPQETPPTLTWASIETANYESMAGNLKKAGCSDQRIADLLAPEVQREARREMTAAYLPMIAAQMAWSPPPEWDSLRPESRDLSALEEAHEVRLMRLFGPTDKGERRHFQDLPSNRPWLDEETHTPIYPTLAKRFQQLRDERRAEVEQLRALAEPPNSDELRSTVEALREQQIKGLAEAHPNAEVEIAEYQLRSSPYAHMLRNIGGLTMSAEEMRAIVGSLESSAPESIQNVLGPERYAIFEESSRKRLAWIEADTGIGHLLDH